MQVNFEIIDEEDDLANGDFTFFYGSEMNLVFSDDNNKIVFNTTLHKTFLITLISNLKDFFYNKKTFTISTFGNAMEYRFELHGNQVFIYEHDELQNALSSQASFDQNLFLNSIKKIMKKYLEFLQKTNSQIIYDKQYQAFEKICKNFP